MVFTCIKRCRKHGGLGFYFYEEIVIGYNIWFDLKWGKSTSFHVIAYTLHRTWAGCLQSPWFLESTMQRQPRRWQVCFFVKNSHHLMLQQIIILKNILQLHTHNLKKKNVYMCIGLWNRPIYRPEVWNINLSISVTTVSNWFYVF